MLNMKFIMLINVKMSTVVGILTIICTINTTSEFESKKSLYFEGSKFWYTTYMPHTIVAGDVIYKYSLYCHNKLFSTKK